jgi:HEAT repeat protein
MPSVPLPFSNQPLSAWITQFQRSENAEDRVRALQAIAFLAPPADATHWTNQALADAEPTVRALAAKQFGATGISLSETTENLLLTLIHDHDPDVRYEAARSLVRTKSPSADLTVPLFLHFLDEPETHPLMLASVVSLLAEIDLSEQLVTHDIEPRVQRLLDHDRAEVREAVSLAFAKWPAMSAKCIDQLLPLLDDPEPVVRENIARTLGQSGIKTEAIRIALETTSQDEDTEVAQAAKIALQRLATQ